MANETKQDKTDKEMAALGAPKCAICSGYHSAGWPCTHTPRPSSPVQMDAGAREWLENEVGNKGEKIHKAAPASEVKRGVPDNFTRYMEALRKCYGKTEAAIAEEVADMFQSSYATEHELRLKAQRELEEERDSNHEAVNQLTETIMSEKNRRSDAELRAEKAEKERDEAKRTLIECCPTCERFKVVGEYCFGCAFDASHKDNVELRSQLSTVREVLEKCSPQIKYVMKAFGCPCGARPEDLERFPHVLGCGFEAALSTLGGKQ